MNTDFNSNLNIFANLAADAIIAGSSYEGGNFYKTFEKFVASFFPLAKTKSSTDLYLLIKIEKLEKEFKDVLERCKLIEEPAHSSNFDLNFYAQEQVKALSKLDIGENFWFLGGWNEDNSGHAMLYKLTRVNQDFWNLAIFNSGRGLEYHFGGIYNHAEHYQTGMFFSRIPSKKVLNDLFIKALATPRIIKASNQTNKIYKGIVCYLQRQQDSPLSISYFQKPQKAGSCTAQAIYAALHHELLSSSSPFAIKTKLPYEKLKFYFLCEELTSIANDFLALNWNRSTHKLLLRTSRIMAYKALKLCPKPIQDVIAEQFPVLGFVQSQLMTKKKESFSHFIEEGIQFEVRDSVELTLPDIIYPPLIPNKKARKKTEIVKLPPFEYDNIQSLIRSLEEFYLSASLNKTHHSNLITIKAHEGIFSLPGLVSQKIFWDSIPEEEIPKFLHALLQLIPFVKNSNQLSQSLMCLQILKAISLKLAKRTINGTFLLGDASFTGKILQEIVQCFQFRLVYFREQLWFNELTQFYQTFQQDFLNSSAEEPFNEMFLIFSSDKEFDLSQPTIKVYKKLLSQNEVANYFGTELISDHEKIFRLINLAGAQSPIIPVEIKVLHTIALASNISLNFGLKFSLGNKSWNELDQLDETKNKIHYYMGHLNPITLEAYQIKFTPIPLQGYFQAKTQNQINFLSPLELEREKAIISQNIAGSLVRILDYFFKYSTDRFEDEMTRKIFSFYLFSPGLLYKELKDQPKIGPIILKSLRQCFDLFALKNDYEIALYFADISMKVQNFVEAFIQYHPSSPLKEECLPYYFDYRLEFIGLLKKQKSLLGTKNLFICISATISWSLAQNPNSESLLEDLLIYKILQKVHLKNHQSTLVEEEIERYLSYVDWKDELSKKDYSKILNAVITRILDIKVEGEWQEHYPYFHGDQYKVDVEEGIIYSENRPILGLSPGLIITTPFSLLYSPEAKIKVHNKTVEVEDFNKTLYFNFSDNLFTALESITKIFNQKRYDLIKLRNSNELPFIGDKREFSQLISLLTGFANPDEWKDYQIWQNHAQPESFLIELPQKNYFVLGNQGRLNVYSDELLQNRLVQLSPRQLEIFKGFEYTEYIQTWSKEGELNLIHLPRYDLSFRLDASTNKAFCEQLPGYYLWHQKSALYPEGILLMGAEDRTLKIILSKHSLKAISCKKLDFSMELEFNTIGIRTIPYLFADVQIIDESLYLKTSILDDNIYLFKLNFFRKHYRKGAYYLKKLTPLSLFTDDQQKSLLEVINLIDKHPYALALKLKSLLILKNNLKQYGHKTFEEDLSFLYKQYLLNLSHMHDFKLTQEEELEILGEKPTRGLFCQRQQELSGETPNLYEFTRSSIQLTQVPSFKWPSFLTFSKKIYAVYDGSKPIKDTVFISTNQLFAQFKEFYDIAVKGPSEQKKLLKNLLLLFEGNEQLEQKDPLVFTAFAILKTALKFPDRFPSSEAFLLNQKDFLDIKLDNENVKSKEAEYGKLLSFLEMKSPCLKPTRFIEYSYPSCNFQYPQSHFNYIFNTSIPLNLRDPHSESMEQLALKFPQSSSLDQLKYFLDSFKQSLEEKTKQLRREIEVNINDFGSTPSMEALKRYANINCKVKLDEAIDLFENGETEKYIRRTQLEIKEILKVDHQIGLYLVHQTRLMQIKRLFNLIKKFERGFLQVWPLLQDELQQSRLALSSNIPNKLQRVFLAYEYRNGIFLREKQIQSIVEIYHLPTDAKFIARLGTGLGKTSAIIPLIQKVRRSKNSLVLNIWPTALYLQNKEDIKNNVFESFKQLADTIEYSRETPSTIQDLTFLLGRLKKAIRDGVQINTTPYHLKCLVLKFLLILETQRKVDGIDNILKLFQEIFLLLQQAEVHLDDTQNDLSPFNELNFTIGHYRVERNENVLLIEKLYQFVLNHPKIRISENKQPHFSSEDFKVFIDEIAPHFSDLLNIHVKLRKQFCDYVLDKTDGIPEWILQHPKKPQIGLIKGLLTVLLEDSLDKFTNVNYGISHNPNVNGEFARPYRASDDPVETAQYDNIHESLSKTYQTYLYTGLDEKKIWNLVQYYQRNISNFIEKFRIPLEQVPLYQEYQKIFPQELHDLAKINKEIVHKTFETFRKYPPLIFAYIRFFIAPNIKKYHEKLSCNPQNFLGLFQGVIALSATPGNRFTYGQGYKESKNSFDQKNTLRILKEKCKGPDSVFCIEGSNAKEALENILDQNLSNPNFKMLIDIGALFEGMSDLSLAKFILSKIKAADPNAKGVVFYQNDRLVVLDNEGKIIPFAECTLQPSERFTYCDNKRIFGADIPQIPEALGIATFNKNVSKVKLIQGIGRLRGFLKNQTLKIGIPKITIETSFKGTKPNITQILQFATTIHRLDKQQQVFRSIKQQMNNEIWKPAFEMLLKSSNPFFCYELFRKIFVVKQSHNPFKIYGAIQKEELSVTLLKNHLKMLRQEILPSLSLLDRSRVFNELAKYDKLIENLAAKKLLPPTVKANTEFVGNQVEVLAENEQQIQSEIMKEGERHLGEEDNLVAYSENPWIVPENYTYKAIVRWKKIEMAALRVFNKIAWIKEKSMLKKRRLLPLSIPLMSLVGAIAFPLVLTFGVIYLFHKIQYNRFLRQKITAPDIQPFKSKLLHTSKEITQFLSLKEMDFSDLFMTANLFRMHDGSDVKFLSVNQKTIYEILVIKENDKYTMILGDHSTDNLYWRKHLISSSEKGFDTPFETFLYDLNQGIVLQAHHNKTHLQLDEKFYRKILAIKLFNGNLVFNEQEFALLKDLLKDESIKKIVRNLVEKSIYYKEETKRNYPKSPLYELLN